MDTLCKCIDILFRQTSPEQILTKLKNAIINNEISSLLVFFDETNFINYAESTLSSYSENEQRYLFHRLITEQKKWESVHSIYHTFLTPLFQIGDRYLTLNIGEPRCKFNQVLPWREIFFRIDQDTIICPYLAYLDNQNLYNRKQFLWPAVIRVEDNELSHILKKGIAENHNHLYGSTHSFQLSWIRYMNNPKLIHDEMRIFNNTNLHARINRGVKDNVHSIIELVELAALIRSILFRCYHRSSFSPEDTVFSGASAFGKEYFVNTLERIVDCLRREFGANVNLPNGKLFCLDYAFEKRDLCYSIDQELRLLIGERFFLYQCSKQCLKGEHDGFTLFEQQLFYLYLVIKCQFRSEMIQVNNQVGFKNFSNYQDRKAEAWKNNAYYWEAMRMALNNRLKNENIVSLEARISPNESYTENIEEVFKIDLAKYFADFDSTDYSKYLRNSFNLKENRKYFMNLPYFFVFHFPKMEDKRKLNKNAFYEMKSRHHDLRNKIKKESKALIKALQTSDYFRCRVHGIDGCANEIGCRPEVFATAYRYLFGEQLKWNNSLARSSSHFPIQLFKTYHAGEDFLDIVDGLRSIDEAYYFLEMQAGSRIGHALALGIYPEKHYAFKNYEIVTNKQNRLDDLVWLLFRSVELNVQIDILLKSELEAEAIELFEEIYGNIINKNHWTCGLIDYYNSMKLRGDDPSLYENKTYTESKFCYDDYDAYYSKKDDIKLNNYRKNECILGLYYYYHFGCSEAIKGNEIITCKINSSYISLISKMQDAMQAFLAEKRIIIECNPTSNVLIGTIDDYLSHPIFRFNSQNLSKTRISDNQMHVCINTDDQGIFDTSMEFEYALIFQSLVSYCEQKNSKLSENRDILAYIDNLRQMGVNASFIGDNNYSNFKR